MHTLLILTAYFLYFVFVIIRVGGTCDVKEYLTNENYKRSVFSRLDIPLTIGLMVAVVIWCLWD